MKRWKKTKVTKLLQILQLKTWRVILDNHLLSRNPKEIAALKISQITILTGQSMLQEIMMHLLLLES